MDDLKSGETFNVSLKNKYTKIAPKFEYLANDKMISTGSLTHISNQFTNMTLRPNSI